MASRFLVDEYKKSRRFQHFRYSRHGSEHDHSCEATSLPGRVQRRCNNLQHWDEATAVSGIKITNAFGLLQAIARDPWISWHIQSLDLKGPDEHSGPLTPDIHTGSLQRLYQTAWPSASEMDDVEFGLWVLQMTPFLADVFVLNLVPNVLEVALSKSWGKADIVDTANLDLLDAMVSRANDPNIRDAPLARLAVVKPYVGHGWNAHASLTPLASFLAINSVREFYMGGVQAFSDDDTDIPFNPRHTVYGTSLRKIEFNGSAVGPRALSALLSRTPHLECLHLGLESKPDHFGGRYNVGHLLAIIAAHVGGSLKELAIYTNPLNTDTYTLTNMHGFTQLEVLELDANSISGPEFSSLELLPSGRFDEYFPEFTMDARSALPRLVDLLPPSLESLKLDFRSIMYRSPRTIHHSDHTEFVFFQLPDLLAGLRDERSSKLPRLRDIVFNPPYDLESYVEKNRDPERTNSIRSILREAETCGVRWERGVFSCFRTFNERFDVKDAGEES